jgi:uncharacterized RDD family membrane protein YckC
MFCVNCGKESADTASFCQSCGVQISGGAVQLHQTSNASEAELASIGRRLGAIALDTIIGILTLYIGWFIWFLIVCGRGQTPGKRIVGIYVASVHDPERWLSWGPMFLREFVVKGLLFGSVLSLISGGLVWILDYLWALWDSSGYTQTLHDKVSESSVYRVQ